MSHLTGKCLCGAVTYKAASPPQSARYCWCRTCRYLAAGNATVNVVFASDGFQIDGATSDHVSVADSGNTMHRRFCTACGTHMFSEAEARPHLIIVRAGTLDDQSLVDPGSNIWLSEAPDWARPDDRLEAFEGQPPVPPTTA
ncbi:GFA family protein [Pyruvatibacter sp.]|uniref:GFA family protein n=1 Tax=Pyruvatibacter sp. TaxID=1981328 RepID=UPI0032657489